MKSILVPYSKALAFAFCSHLLVSLLWSVLYHFNILKTFSYSSCVTAFSVLIALACGILLGAMIKKRVFIHGLLIAFLSTGLSLLIHSSFSIILLVRLLVKAIVFILGMFLGRKIYSR